MTRYFLTPPFPQILKTTNTKMHFWNPNYVERYLWLAESSSSTLLPFRVISEEFRSCGICGGQSVTGAGFVTVRQFPLPIFTPSTAPYSLIILSSRWVTMCSHQLNSMLWSSRYPRLLIWYVTPVVW
jgi:hypothetical protein